MKALKILALMIAAVAVVALASIYSGLFSFAADEPHWAITIRMIDMARERSIASAANSISAPDNLEDAKVIAAGAGEYAEMCVGCHLAPGMKDTEMRTGLYPRPPNLFEAGAARSAAQQFWIVKHGLKMSGMPAWGLTHDDARIWSMVAFVRKLPGLSPDAYHELSESSEGHHHHGDADEEHAEGSDASKASPEDHR